MAPMRDANDQASTNQSLYMEDDKEEEDVIHPKMDDHSSAHSMEAAPLLREIKKIPRPSS